MPRLPTLRVTGSQFISTPPGESTAVIVLPPASGAGRAGGRRRPMSPGLLVSGQQLIALDPPLGLRVRGLRGEVAQGPDDRPVQGAGGGGDLRARRLVHERPELVREAGHRAGDADPADGRAAADAVDPAP